MAAVGNSESRNGKSHTPPPHNLSYGYDQPGDRPYSSNNSTSYGYNQPGDRDPIPPYGFSQPGYGYGLPASASNSQQANVVVTSGPRIVVAPASADGPPPNTSIGLVMSILVTLLCGCPCGIVAIVYNIKARTFVDVGRYTNARSALTVMWVWFAVSLMSGVTAWIVFGIRLKELNDHAYQPENSYFRDNLY